MIRCSLIYPLIEVVDLCPRIRKSYLISFEVFQFGSCFLEKGPSLSNRVRHFFDVSRIQMKIFRFWKFCFAFTNNLKRCLYRIQRKGAETSAIYRCRDNLPFDKSWGYQWVYWGWTVCFRALLRDDVLVQLLRPNLFFFRHIRLNYILYYGSVPRRHIRLVWSWYFLIRKLTLRLIFTITVKPIFDLVASFWKIWSFAFLNILFQWWV